MDMISNIFNLKNELVVFWFMGSLFCIYVYFPALKALYDTNLKAFIFFIAVISFVSFGFNFITRIVEYIYVAFDKPPFSFQSQLTEKFEAADFSTVYFCLGGLAYKYNDKINSLPVKKKNIICCVGLVFSNMILCSYAFFKSSSIELSVWNVVKGGYSTIPTLLSTLFIYGLCLNYNNDNKIICHISKNTLGIYILHGMVNTISTKLSLPSFFGKNLFLVLLHTACVIMICLGLIWIIKKYHF